MYRIMLDKACFIENIINVDFWRAAKYESMNKLIFIHTLISVFLKEELFYVTPW